MIKPIKKIMSKRRKIHKDIESVPAGYANGISTQLAHELTFHPKTKGLDSIDKDQIIRNAAKAYGEFLNALGCDWENDPNSDNTPMRVAKAYVNDLWRGRYEILSDVTSFPSDGYKGMVIERNIPIVSMCSHHHQTIKGVAHVGYIVGEKGRVIGLSKLNRIVEHFSRRGAIQEQLTAAIKNAVDKVCENNLGVIVTVVGTHNCVSCRGVKHEGASMVTTDENGVFADNTNLARMEFFNSLKINVNI